MDKLVETAKEAFWNPEAWIRDQWVKAEAAKLACGSRVLDAGAGASKYRPFFAHCKYENQDFCDYKGELVKYLQPIQYVCDITKIPVPDATFDAILCTEVLEHVVNPMAVLEEFSRILKPGGRLLLTAPHISHLHMQPYHFYGGFTHFWYRHWLPDYNFSIESILPQGGPGRTASFFLQAFYTALQNREPSLGSCKRFCSMATRLLLKVPAHVLLPRTLPRWDTELDANEICSGFMVTATRLENPIVEPPSV